jgi:putative membrane-bound dehydrogenase-like protein
VAPCSEAAYNYSYRIGVLSRRPRLHRVSKTMTPASKAFVASLALCLLTGGTQPALGQTGIEAGGFQVLGKPPGSVRTQEMGEFPKGRWQNNDQLWWTGAKPGDRLCLAIPIRKAGTYRVAAILTKARDYAIVQLYLDGKKTAGPIDLYHPEVISTKPVSLGIYRLAAGQHKLTVEIIGANAKAIKAYMFGLDCLVFEPAGEAGLRPFTVPAPLYPYVSLSPEEAAKAMRLPEGFSVRLAAGEPDVKQPIAMALDDRGRLWVAEAYEYPIRAKGDKGRDRILIFEDTKGEGHFDKRTVFYEGLNLVSGLEVGFGGVWVGAAPYLLYIPIKKGEDKPAGPPRVLLDGWHYEDTHETLNTFTWGPDGWLYGCHGVFTHSRVGKPGTPDKDRIPINAGIWRYHPTRHVFEVFAEGTSNPWGLDFDDYGQCFCTACVIPHLWHIIQGARYQRQAGPHLDPYAYADIQTIADHLHFVGNQWSPNDRRRSDELGGGHAHAGAMIYLGGSWPATYRSAIFMNNIHGNRINMDWLKHKGSGYVGSHGPDFILTDDQSSQILNLRYGPDGQVWMIDWYDRSQCHVPNPQVPDRSTGRIFQVRYKNVKPVHVDLQKASDAELVKMQLHPNDWYVRHARRLLQERAAAGKLQPGAHAALAKIALEHPDETRRLRGLWALHVTGGLTDEIAYKALAGKGQYERAWAVQLLLDRPELTPSPGTLKKFAEMARRDPSPVVRLYLASACQRLPVKARWAILDGLTSHPEDATDHNLPLMYWYAAGPLADHDPQRALDWAVVAGQNIPLVRDFMVRRIGSATNAKALDLLVAGLARAKTTEQQIAFLRGMNQALVGVRKLAPPAGWADISARLTGSDHPEVRLQALALAVTFGDSKAADKMRQLSADAAADPALRKRALASLLGARTPDLAGLLQKLLTDPALRVQALRGLAAYDDPATPRAVLAVYGKLPPAEKRDALATLCSRAAYAEALLRAIGKKEVPAADLSADLVRQIRNLGKPGLDKQLAQVWGSVRQSSADKTKLIAQYKKLLLSPPRIAPDPTLGRAVFAKTCQQCHTLYGVGGKVGPDITGSNRADLDYLLSNILDPSAIIPKEYQATVVITKDGRVLTGIVREQGHKALTLQTATEVVVLPRDEIEETRPSELSMMPEDLLGPLSEHEVRSLVAYLQGRRQVPMRATPDNVSGFFNGKDLTGWQGDPKVWSVAVGELVARGPAKDSLLVSDLLVDDFALRFEFQVSAAARGTLLLRGWRTDEGRWEGLEVDLGKDSATAPGKGWRQVAILARGPHIQIQMDKGPAHTLAAGRLSGLLGLRLTLPATETARFRNVQLHLLLDKRRRGSANRPSRLIEKKSFCINYNY